MELGVRETEGMSSEDKEECGHHEAGCRAPGSPLGALWQSSGRRDWGSMDTGICRAESLCCPSETVTTLWIGYTPISNKKFKKRARPEDKEKPANMMRIWHLWKEREKEGELGGRTLRLLCCLKKNPDSRANTAQFVPGRNGVALDLWPCSVSGCIGWEQPGVSMASVWGHDGPEGVGAAGSLLRYSLTMEVWAVHLQPCPASHGLLLEVIPKHTNPFQYTQTKCTLHSTWPNTKKKKKKPVQAHLNVTSDELNYDRAEIRVKRHSALHGLKSN